MLKGFWRSNHHTKNLGFPRSYKWTGRLWSLTDTICAPGFLGRYKMSSRIFKKLHTKFQGLRRVTKGSGSFVYVIINGLRILEASEKSSDEFTEKVWGLRDWTKGHKKNLHLSRYEKILGVIKTLFSRFRDLGGVTEGSGNGDALNKQFGDFKSHQRRLFGEFGGFIEWHWVP